MPTTRLLLPLLLVLLGSTGCDKRAPLRAELEAAELMLKSKQADVAALQIESKTLNASLGSKYSMAGVGQIERLKKEAAELQARAEDLKKKRQIIEDKHNAMRAETKAYLANHGKN
jgi:hypothetical protein